VVEGRDLREEVIYAGRQGKYDRPAQQLRRSPEVIEVEVREAEFNAAQN